MKLPSFSAVFVIAFLVSHTAFAEIPEKLHRLILTKAPEMDANGDGKVTMEELEKAFPDLPKNYQRVIRGALPDIGVEGDSDTEVSRKQNCLLMGHSFFRPVADGMKEHAHRAGFTDHHPRVVSSGAASGAPLSLWNNDGNRKLIQEILDAGGIEMMGMTFFPELPGHPHIGPEIEAIEGYDNWINYALQSNPDLKRVFIAVSWDYLTDRMKGGEKPQKERIAMIDRAVAKMQSHIEILRKKYPKVEFQCIPYGYGAYELEKRLGSGELPGIEHRRTPDKKGLEASIYRDKTGHASPILIELSQLIWLRAIFGIDLVKDYPDYESEYDLAMLKQIAMDLMETHEEKYGKPRSGGGK